MRKKTCACGRKHDRPGQRQCKLCHAVDMKFRRQAGCSMSALMDRARELEAENERLNALLNTPELHDFAKAVVLEAAHQRGRWAPDDVAKSDADWFWLIGYLAGKALHTPVSKDLARVGGVFETAVRDERLHRIITVAAAAANWHAQVLARAEAPR